MTIQKPRAMGGTWDITGDSVGGIAPASLDERQRACWTIMCQAKDAEDRQDLLDSLGLVPDFEYLRSLREARA